MTDCMKESCYIEGDAGDVGSISGPERSPLEGNDNPLQYSCLENPMDRRACGLPSMKLSRVRFQWATEHAHTPQGRTSVVRTLLSLQKAAGTSVHPPLWRNYILSKFSSRKEENVVSTLLPWKVSRCFQGVENRTLLAQSILNISVFREIPSVTSKPACYAIIFLVPFVRRAAKLPKLWSLVF